MYGKKGFNPYPAMRPLVLVRRLRLIVEELPYLQEALQRIRSRLFDLRQRMEVFD
jgi:hypothetical protein